MSISTYRPLPSELRDIQLEMEEIARSYGLDFFETSFKNQLHRSIPPHNS